MCSENFHSTKLPYSANLSQIIWWWDFEILLSLVKRSDEDEGNGVKRALLEVIASGVATTPADVQRYASCTFYVSSKAQEDGRSTEGIIESTVDYLARNEFMTLRKTEEGKAEVLCRLNS